MTHAEIWSGAPAIYAARIIELEKQLGECSGALQFTEKQIAMLRKAAYSGGVYDNYDILIQREDWLAIMGELP